MYGNHVHANVSADDGLWMSECMSEHDKSATVESRFKIVVFWGCKKNGKESNNDPSVLPTCRRR
jgi:hypothetical protein